MWLLIQRATAVGRVSSFTPSRFTQGFSSVLKVISILLLRKKRLTSPSFYRSVFTWFWHNLNVTLMFLDYERRRGPAHVQCLGTRPGKCDVCEEGRSTRVTLKVLGLGFTFLVTLYREGTRHREKQICCEFGIFLSSLQKLYWAWIVFALFPFPPKRHFSQKGGLVLLYSVLFSLSVGS